MIWLTKEDIINLHSKIIAATGGLDGVRNVGLIEAALQLPFQTFDGNELYPSDIDKIARLSFSLTCNHPFLDGNKRIGAFALAICLKLNSYKTNISDDELSKMFLSLAAGNVDFDSFKKWVEEHII